MSSEATALTMPSSTPAKLAYTPIADLPGIIASARAAFAAGTTKPLSWRRAQLYALARLVEENQAAILEALHADLRKPQFEAAIHEVALVAGEARHMAAHLGAWAAPEPVVTPSMHLPASSYVVKDPLGVVLVITPWNFPFCASPGRASARPPAPPRPRFISPSPPPCLLFPQTSPSTPSPRCWPRATRRC